jgi:phage terminase large subunit GpA-like protein
MTENTEILHPGVTPLCSSLLSLALTPPTRLTLSQWSERNIILSSEYAARSSELRLFGWQREIFDAFTDPRVQDIVMMCGTQLVKTLLAQCALAYVICEDPGPVLLVEPTDTDAKDFSRERLAPMIRDCPCLHGKISASFTATESSGTGTSNRLQAKDFPGGNLSLVGAGAPGNLARRTIRYLFCDEIDKYKGDIKEEGDPINLAWERTATFGSRRKRILCCSPTIAGRSRIGKAYKASDQRRPYVPCWKCGEYQTLHFFPDTGGGVRFDSSVPREKQAETAYYQCSNAHCAARWDDIQRVQSCEKAEWRSHAPFKGSAGFWISHLYSPWKKLSDIVQTFLDSKDDRAAYKTFINTNLALEWQEDGETPDAELLYARREGYPFGSAAVIPARGLFLTAAVDVQDSPPRLEVEVKAWGRGRENWSVFYDIIQVFAQNGHPLPVTSRELWDKLDAEVLQRNWTHESGHTLPIRAMAIDTGNRPKPVYEFARRHPQLSYGPAGIKLHSARTVIPIKGTPDPLRVISSISKEDMSRKRQGVRIIGVGTVCAKQEIYDTLRHVLPKPDGSLSGAPVPACYHFPYYDLVYFEGLCSEVRIEKENGKIVYEKRGARNEPIDLSCYNRAAAACAGIDRFSDAQWRTLEEALSPACLTSSASVIHSVVGGVQSPTLPTSSVSVSSSGTEEAPPRAASVPAPQPQPVLTPSPAPPLGPSPAYGRPAPLSRPVRGRF